MYTIDLVRHAESEWVEKADKMAIPVFGGRMLKVPLSNRGREQARAFGRYLEPQRVQPREFFSSKAVRAVETHTCAAEASARLKRAKLRQQEHFIEGSWGEWEGQPRSIADEPRYAQELLRLGFDFRPPGGESFRDIRYRAITGMIGAVSVQPPGSRIVIYTHKNVIKSLVYRHLGWTVEQTYAAAVGILSITRFVYKNPDGFRLEFFNRPTVVLPRR